MRGPKAEGWGSKLRTLQPPGHLARLAFLASLAYEGFCADTTIKRDLRVDLT